MIHGINKIIAKVLSNILISVIGSLISDNQTAFVSRKQINYWWFHDCKWAYLDLKKVRNSSIILKVDFSQGFWYCLMRIFGWDNGVYGLWHQMARDDSWVLIWFCWIHVSEEAADKEAADEETADVESTDVEAVMSFSFNKTLAIWISQFLLGLI